MPSYSHFDYYLRSIITALLAMTVLGVTAWQVISGNGVSGPFDVVSAIGTPTPPTFPISIVNTIHRTDVFTASDGSGTFTLGINKVSTFLPGPTCPILPNGDRTFLGEGT